MCIILGTDKLIKTIITSTVGMLSDSLASIRPISIIGTNVSIFYYGIKVTITKGRTRA